MPARLHSEYISLPSHFAFRLMSCCALKSLAICNGLMRKSDALTTWNALIDLVYEESADVGYNNSCFSDLFDCRRSVPEDLPRGQVYVLLLLKLINADIEARISALAWLQELTSELPSIRHDLRLSVATSHLSAARRACSHLSKPLQEHRNSVVAESGQRFPTLSASARLLLGSVLEESLQGFEAIFSSERGYSMETYLTFANIVWIAAHRQDDLWNTLEGPMKALSLQHAKNNMNVFIKFILDCCLHVQCDAMVAACVHLVASTSGSAIFQREALSALSPSLSICLVVKHITHDTDPHLQTFHLPNLRSLLLGAQNEGSISAAALLLVFLSVCTPSIWDKADARAPVLHAAALHSTFAWEPAATAASHIIDSILEDEVSTVQNAARSIIFERAKLPEKFAPESNSGLRDSQLWRQWQNEALSWATTGPVRVLASRSFEIFQHLDPIASADMLVEILGRLSGTISDVGEDLRLFSVDALKAVTALAGPDHPQQQSADDIAAICFWTGAAAVTTANEDECSQALLLMISHLQAMHSGSSDPAKLLTDHQPREWDQSSPSWSHAVLTAIRCSNTRDSALSCIRLLLLCGASQCVPSVEEWLGMCVMTMMPLFVMAFEASSATTDIRTIAALLAEACGRCGRSEMQRLCEAVASGRFKIADDLIRQGVNVLRASYPPEFNAVLASLCFGSALAPDVAVRGAALKVSKAFLLGLGDARSHLMLLGPDLWMPMLQCVQSLDDLSSDALECLNLGGRTSGSHDQRAILRMSFQWHGAQPILEQDAAIPSRVFGTPSRSGWAIADPQEAALRTRGNMASVFHLCERDLDVPPTAVHVDFVDETSDGSIWSASESTQADATPLLGDIVNQLHDLSSFFVDDAGSSPKTSLSRQNTQNGPHGLSRSNTQNGQRNVAKVMARAAVQPSISPSRLSPADSFAFKIEDIAPPQAGFGDPISSPRKENLLALPTSVPFHFNVA